MITPNRIVQNIIKPNRRIRKLKQENNTISKSDVESYDKKITERTKEELIYYMNKKGSISNIVNSLSKKLIYDLLMELKHK